MLYKLYDKRETRIKSGGGESKSEKQENGNEISLMREYYECVN